MSEGHFPECRVFEPIGQDSFWLGCQDVRVSEKRQELPMPHVLSLWPHWSMSGPIHKHPPYLTWRHQGGFLRPYTDGIRYCQWVPVSFHWRWRIESCNMWASSRGLGGTRGGILLVTYTQTIPAETAWPRLLSLRRNLTEVHQKACQSVHTFFFLWLLLVELYPGAPQPWGLEVTCPYLHFFEMSGTKGQANNAELWWAPHCE